eukprot:jgi/Chlat1/9180/Chrsp97S08458
MLRAAVGRLRLREGAARSVAASVRGLEEFFPPPGARPQQGKGKDASPSPPPPAVGRSWKAAELRLKGDTDLHKLWWVLAKERNVLETERAASRSQRRPMHDPSRVMKVKKSMARIKLVLSERAHYEEDAARRRSAWKVLACI